MSNLVVDVSLGDSGFGNVKLDQSFQNLRIEIFDLGVSD
jgi:hypothetical protein